MSAGVAAKVVTAGIGIAFDVADYKQRRSDGKGVVQSVGQMAIEAALWSNIYTRPIMIGITAGQIVKAGADALVAYGKNGGNLNARQINNVYKNGAGYVGGNFMDTNNASTMRQRGLQAMEQSGYNVRSVLGSEARNFHQRYY